MILKLEECQHHHTLRKSEQISREEKYRKNYETRGNKFQENRGTFEGKMNIAPLYFPTPISKDASARRVNPTHSNFLIEIIIPLNGYYTFKIAECPIF